MEFNAVFRRWQTDVQTQSDRLGVQPRWPKVSEINTLATNTYRRLKLRGVWDGLVKKKSPAYPATPSPTPKPGTRGGKCFNCDSPDHLLPDCDKPIDEEKVAKCRAAYHHKKNRPKHKTSRDGRPLILNKNGTYVVDTKAYMAYKASLVKNPTTDPNKSTHDSPQPDVTSTSPDVTSQADSIRSAIRSN